jgi:4-oxalocrotonate tautomerase
MILEVVIMPNIFIEMLEGKSIEKKKLLVKELTEVTSDVLGTDPNNVNIRILNVKKEDVAKGGKLFIDIFK